MTPFVRGIIISVHDEIGSRSPRSHLRIVETFASNENLQKRSYRKHTNEIF